MASIGGAHDHIQMDAEENKVIAESHRSSHIGWLRAAVLGANDGIVSTASLILGVAAAHGSTQNIIVAGASGLVAGAMSMAAGEYVSVSSQSDTETADLARESAELESDIDYERRELSEIYVGRGLEPNLAAEVARQLMEHDALGSHARDELGINEIVRARPVQAAFASAGAFAAGAVLPLLTAIAAAENYISFAVPAASLLFLTLLGIASAKVGGANSFRAASRVVFWGSLAMAVTAGLGSLVGVAV